MLSEYQVDLINTTVCQIIIGQIVTGELCLGMKQSGMYLYIQN